MHPPKYLNRNKNITLHHGKAYRGFPVQTQRGPLCAEYLERMYQTLVNALADNPRLLVIRFELNFPSDQSIEGDSHITRFWSSLKSKLHFDLNRKTKSWSRTVHNSPYFIWVKERNKSQNFHYHCALIVDNNTYKGLGSYTCTGDSLSALIKGAWVSALGVPSLDGKRVVNFSVNGSYYLNPNHGDFIYRFNECFYRMSYLAKARTKAYKGTGNAIGGSNLIEHVSKFQLGLFGPGILSL